MVYLTLIFLKKINLMLINIYLITKIFPKLIKK